MQKPVLCALALSGLAACFGEPLTWKQNPVVVQRFYAEQFQDQPFDVGPVSVLSEERGKLRTYLLTPCRNGTRVCGAHVGSVSKTPDFTIVSGAYPGRTFYLSPGGDGYLLVNGRTISLAWNE
ncbi:hypothetical protein SAMN04488515_3315 [Cognatiyoonia koreensis]|uniref:Lipoprotein n=1 Tax=Cognatiyoonia koreensis TaxID=364200 RepID=A0A1I0RV93_9RHOB|nr:hypothetical protein [Cognatiyoonia koreensis]SEW45299.1 hypothetical protein SAMN04488515_3315 [Cognatiyoonia koreensis]